MLQIIMLQAGQELAGGTINWIAYGEQIGNGAVKHCVAVQEWCSLDLCYPDWGLWVSSVSPAEC